ncbi:hypothetical protein FOC1_g10008041 [Fusarium oxysporum f. sp. cubense race 1]|uniref:AB hydrolase-1 domain-containing protein n=1 Tax=Fusarium oxysporum f. sp. cubense (strain race 1) TaxID=1229664 RepID=N4TMG9_FUSC1|nr:hypothetical protein FOC1_g10008041 [Fusarium oxysporum f. sp. cubense race 1]
MLPEPTLTLTLPSIHDGLTLDCRIYHPLSLSANPKAPTWLKHAAVVAHPYAPMGGCYDDPVVGGAAAQLLRKGFLVGTFNFRGAHGSAGRTSWTAKPERDDYATVVAFVLHYVHDLDPFRPHIDNTLHSEPSTPTRLEAPVSLDAAVTSAPRPRPILLMGGYSYGGMIVTQIPPLDAILQPFISPIAGSDAAEVRLRAAHLAEQQNINPPTAVVPPEPGEHLPRITDLTMPRPAYLMISPPQGVVTHLATMSLLPSALVKNKDPQDVAAEEKLVRNPSLVIFGDEDGFAPVGKFRSWKAKMEGKMGSQFKGTEIETAGHFWVEEGVLDQLRERVGEFADELLAG